MKEISIELKGTLGEQLKTLRILKGFKQSEFAKILGTTPQTINNIESGKVKIINPKAESYLAELGYELSISSKKEEN